MPELSLIVIRVSDIEVSKAFYQLFGLEFVREKHGNGPVHYSSLLGTTVLEIYPASDRNRVSDSVRLGFHVAEPRLLIAELLELGIHATSKHEYGSVFEDPDGIKVEVSYRDI